MCKLILAYAVHYAWRYVWAWRDSNECLLFTVLTLNSGVADSEGVWLKPPSRPFDSKFHFRGVFWMNLGYRIYPKYPHPLLFTLNICTSLQQVNFITYEYVSDSWLSDKQCRPWSDNAFCDVWSGSTLFVQVCLPEYAVSTIIWSDRTPTSHHPRLRTHPGSACVYLYLFCGIWSGSAQFANYPLCVCVCVGVGVGGGGWWEAVFPDSNGLNRSYDYLP